MEAVNTSSAPAAVGAYSQAIRDGNHLYVSGQLPLAADTGELVGDSFDSQVSQCLSNLRNVLEAGGSSLDRAVKVTVYLTDLNRFSVLNEVYGRYFDRHAPARCCVQVSALPRNAQVEIDAIAVVSSEAD